MDLPAHEVRLELWLDGESVTGRASAPGEAAREFAGWMGLVAAIEGLIDSHHDGGASDDGEPARRPEGLQDGPVA